MFHSTDGTGVSHSLLVLATIILFTPTLMAQQTMPSQPPLAPTLTNSIAMELELIPAGEFMMGSDIKNKNSNPDELPLHRVAISKQFYMGKYEVTQEQWSAVMGTNPSKRKNPQFAVESVTWGEVQEFLKRLNEKEGTSAYRLPTEAEWEYVCRAGTTTEYSFGDDQKLLKEYGWSEEEARGKPKPVGQKKPNPWGLHDMHGGVWEWCSDWYDAEYYIKSPEQDPQGPAKGTDKVERGGSYDSVFWRSRSALRTSGDPKDREADVGFRVVREVGR